MHRGTTKWSQGPCLPSVTSAHQAGDAEETEETDDFLPKNTSVKNNHA